MHDSTLLEIARRYGLADSSRLTAWRSRLDEDRWTEELVDRVTISPSRPPIDLERSCRRMPRGGSATIGRAPHPKDWRARGLIRERVDASLAAIEENEGLNAFTAVFADQAREHADDLDARRARGEDVGPLAGWTVAVKDLMSVRGHITTGGTRALDLPQAVDDALVVARLREAGAVVVGATNLHALAYGALSTSSDAGAVANPLRPEAIAGGSSGGSAAAVAAGLVDMAVGTDTAGSIRIPASLCGVTGLKPTFGLVPVTGVQPLGPTLDHVGPITRSVADAARAVEVMADTPVSLAGPSRRPLDGVTVGRPAGYFFDHLDGAVRTCVERAFSAVGDLGGEVREVELPSVHLSPGIQLATLSAEAFDVHADLLRERGRLLPEDVRLRLEVGMFRPAPGYARAQRLRGVMQAELDEVMAEVDVVMTPTVPVTAPGVGVTRLEVDGASWTTQAALTRLTMPFNLVGYPALTMPWAADPSGGSIGLQLASAPMAEATLLGVARVLEEYRTG